MKRNLIGLAAALVAATVMGQCAWGQGTVDNTRRSMGNLQPDSYTAGRAIHGSNRGAPSAGVRTFVIPQYGPYPYANPGFYGGYDPFYGNGYGFHPYHPYYVRRYRYGYLPPVIVPPGAFFGPRFGPFPGRVW
ncbi:MAG: hypothetical protein ABIP48_14245 [Planctomycetota bacterium]